MYLGIAAFLIAFAFFMQSLFILLSLPLFILYMTRYQIVPEERAMLSLFGEQYQQYKAKVRRWL
jgi:protein-S-isoprenylcysteine O-methyltransferase Ste14